MAPCPVAGGIFHAASSTHCTLVASFDPSTAQWEALGAALEGTDVQAVLPLANGDLIVVGAFHCPSVLGTYNIARRDGTSWSALGGGAVPVSG